MFALSSWSWLRHYQLRITKLFEGKEFTVKIRSVPAISNTSAVSELIFSPIRLLFRFSPSMFQSNSPICYNLVFNLVLYVLDGRMERLPSQEEIPFVTQATECHLILIDRTNFRRLLKSLNIQIELPVYSVTCSCFNRFNSTHRIQI